MLVDTTHRLGELTEPAVFGPEVAKQHDELVGAVAFGILVSASFNSSYD